MPNRVDLAIQTQEGRRRGLVLHQIIVPAAEFVIPANAGIHFAQKANGFPPSRE
jgi:hypothetical protein